MSGVNVWVQPTEFSPMCEYKLPTRRGKDLRKVLSNCGMWVTPYERIAAALKTGSKTVKRCPLCATGRRVREPKMTVTKDSPTA